MKIMLSFPGHLKTVPMSKYIHQSLIAMGHDVVLLNFGVHGVYPSILKKISNKKKAKRGQATLGQKGKKGTGYF